MTRRKKGEGRGLEYFEVALIKRMMDQRFPRDRIASFFVRPGRIISPAFTSEIAKGKIGVGVEAASLQELETFVARRMNETESIRQTEVTPLSPTRVREVLSLAKDSQESLPSLENRLLEYKAFFPTDKLGRAKVAKTVAALANARGGYIFFGIRDDRSVIGLSEVTNLERQWQSLSQCINEHFAPVPAWEHAMVPIAGFEVGVMYVYEAQNKPIVCVKDYDHDLHKSCVYMRYSALTKVVEPGDLFAMLAERDQRVARLALTGGLEIGSAPETPTAIAAAE